MDSGRDSRAEDAAHHTSFCRPDYPVVFVFYASICERLSEKIFSAALPYIPAPPITVRAAYRSKTFNLPSRFSPE